MVQDHMPDNLLEALDKVSCFTVASRLLHGRFTVASRLLNGHLTGASRALHHHFTLILLLLHDCLINHLFVFQLVNQSPEQTCHFGEIVPRIIVQEPTSITNDSCLDK